MIALTRAVSPTIDQCELTYRERVPIDPGRATTQHRAYEAALERLGFRITRVSAAPEHPDAVFVEDMAVVTEELAIVARPGAESRRGEVEPVATALSSYRELRRIEAPGTLDGGDVLRVGRTVWVGVSSRTNDPGFEQLRSLLEPLGYRVRAVSVRGCLHLKTAATAVGRDTVLLNPACVDAEAFAGLRVQTVDAAEPGAANALWWGGDDVVVPASGPRTADRLAELGLIPVAVDISELEKAEAGVTCCSILLEP